MGVQAIQGEVMVLAVAAFNENEAVNPYLWRKFLPLSIYIYVYNFSASDFRHFLKLRKN